jgi:hypothetical protein
MNKSTNKTLIMIGFIAAMAGLALAFFAGIFAQSNAIVILILMVLGIIVGALSVSRKEIVPLLVAAIALVVVGTAGYEPLNNMVSGLGNVINAMINYAARLMAPAAVISAVRELIYVALEK